MYNLLTCGHGKLPDPVEFALLRIADKSCAYVHLCKSTYYYYAIHKLQYTCKYLLYIQYKY